MIHEHLQIIVNHLHAHPHWGWVIAFFIAFLESLAVIGTIVPGSVTMTAIGVLIGSEVLPAWSTILWAVLGAYGGDCLSYWVGLHYNERLRRMWPFNKKPHWLAKGEQFFKAHGGKSVMIGRFTGPVRSLVPMIAGLLKMRPARFLPIAFVTAVMWAIVYMLPGIIIGALSLELPPKLATQFIVISLIVIAILGILIWLVKYFFEQTWDQINRLLTHWWNYLNTHKSSHWITVTLRNPQHEEDHQQLVRAVFAIVFFVLFLVLGFFTVTHGLLTHFNAPLYSLLQSLRIKQIDNFMIAMTMLGDKHVLFALAGVIFIWLLWIRRWWAALHLTIMTAGAAVMIDVVKALIYSPRPPIVLATDFTSSFPSGHTLLSTALFGFLAVLITDGTPKQKRFWPFVIVMTIVFFVALSRVYLGAHWLTDVIASVCLGITWLLITIISYRRKSSVPPPPYKLAAIAIISAVIFWAGYTAIELKDAYLEYAPTVPMQMLGQDSWWNQEPGQIPFYRVNRLGRPAQPLNVQWLGYLEYIFPALERNGWRLHPSKFGLQTVINRVLPSKLQYSQHLPILPMLYHNRSPVLLLTKELGDDQPIVILRLWQSDVVVGDGRVPLWLGSVSYYYPPKKALSVHESHTDLEYVDVLKELVPALSDFQSKIVQIPKNMQPPEFAKANLTWDGKLLLIK